VCVCVCVSNEEGIHDVVVLSERTEHLPLIEIRIKECQGGVTLPTASCHNVTCVNYLSGFVKLTHTASPCHMLQ